MELIFEQLNELLEKVDLYANGKAINAIHHESDYDSVTNIYATPDSEYFLKVVTEQDSYGSQSLSKMKFVKAKVETVVTYDE